MFFLKVRRWGVTKPKQIVTRFAPCLSLQVPSVTQVYHESLPMFYPNLCYTNLLQTYYKPITNDLAVLPAIPVITQLC